MLIYNSPFQYVSGGEVFESKNDSYKIPPHCFCGAFVHKRKDQLEMVPLKMLSAKICIVVLLSTLIWNHGIRCGNPLTGAARSRVLLSTYTFMLQQLHKTQCAAVQLSRFW